ncbi:MAG: MYXO-CTERM sorting domain-containing protein [Minicystis sp.]
MSRRASLLALAAALAGCGAGDDALPTAAPPPRETLVRPDTPGNNLLFRFADTDAVETFGSTGGHFLVHFTRQGPNAVPAADTDSSGVPDFVEEVASVYEEVLTKYHDDLGFRPPVSDEGLADNGGDGRFDVYLVDFAGKGDGNYQNDTCDAQNKQICAGYMVQENDFTGYGYPSTQVANRILGSHEFFHAVQAAYDIGQGSVLAEGTAVWATEQFDPSLNDFEGFLPGYLDNPDRPLDTPLPGPVDPFSYGSAIFFEFLEEHYGAGTIRDLWARCDNGANGEADPMWITELEPLLQKKAQVSFADALSSFAVWNLFTGQNADPTRSYLHGSAYPPVKMNDETAPFQKDLLRVYYASAQYYRIFPNGRPTMTAALIAHPDSPDDTKDLRVLLTARRGKEYDQVLRLADVSAGTETIDTNGADRLVVIVTNNATSGSSRRPALCIGTAGEVAACAKKVTDSNNGSGGGGAGGSGGAGGGGTMPPATEPSGCGCRVAAPADTTPGALVAVALAALYRRRRRARAAARAIPTA